MLDPRRYLVKMAEESQAKIAELSISDLKALLDFNDREFREVRLIEKLNAKSGEPSSVSDLEWDMLWLTKDALTEALRDRTKSILDFRPTASVKP